MIDASGSNSIGAIHDDLPRELVPKRWCSGASESGKAERLTNELFHVADRLLETDHDGSGDDAVADV